MGEGRVFDTPESDFTEISPMIPPHWARIVGMDIGWDHPTACVWCAWDRDSDIVHVYEEYKVSHAIPVIHAAAIRGRGPWIPVAWPHDALAHDKSSGAQIAQAYRELGVNMLPQKATHAPEKGKMEGTGGYGVESGILEIANRLKTGRLKVAKHLADWFEEYRLYHRENGLLVKENDDLLSATRILIMMLRHAKVFSTTNRLPIVKPWMPSDSGMGTLG